MRLAILAVIATGCGGGHATTPAQPAPAVPALAAARWVPAQPSYVFASRDLGLAQRGLRDAIEVLGIAGEVELRDVVQASIGLLGVDALHGDAVAAIGVDPHGSWAVFSEELSPTLVVHLTAPDQMAAYVDRMRERGLVTRSVIIEERGDKLEVFSATLPGHVTISWAIAGDWMWVHVAPRQARDDGTRWFTSSRAAAAAGWTADWAWAERAAGAAAAVIGFVDPRGFVAHAISRHADAAACLKLVEPIRRIAIAIESDDHHAGARLAFDVGSTAGIRDALIAAPPGWGASAGPAALAAQWNLDLTAVRPWIAPCVAAVNGSLGALDETGIRAGRGLLLGFDPDGLTGSGAVALDLTRAAFIERQLAQIPLRGTLERARTFGTEKGHSIAIPFSVTVDYLLDDRRAIFAIGDGLLTRLVAPGPASPPPIFALDVAPPALPVQTWAQLLYLLESRELAKSPGPRWQHAAEAMMRWRDGHVTVTAEPSELVITAVGHRK